MLDPDIAALVGDPAPMPALTADILPTVRAQMAMIGRSLPGATIDAVEDHDADGVPVRLYRPAGDAPLPLLVFLHGGGWMLGDLDSHDAMHRHLAARAGCAVLGVGYRLAPEYPFPAGLDDAATALAWIRREAPALGCDPARIALGGESAGSNLTAALTLRLRAEGGAQPLFQLLVHPATDLRFRLPSFEQVKVAGFTRDYLDGGAAMYAGGADLADPLISPLRADRHDGLAPAIVLTAAGGPAARRRRILRAGADRRRCGDAGVSPAGAATRLHVPARDTARGVAVLRYHRASRAPLPCRRISGLR